MIYSSATELTLPDHLGHTRVVVDEDENVLQETAYYPYRTPIAALSSETKYNYLYTGKEFLDNFGLNWYDHHARYYDAEVGRWWAVDPALQVASPYMAMGNNPMMNIDEDGEFAFLAALAIGAAISAGSYTASIAFSKGGFDNWSWGGFAQSAGIGAVSGVLTAGIGNALNGMSGFGTEMARAGMHGFVNGSIGELSGGSFKNGFASGALSSLANSGFQKVGGDFAKSIGGGTAFGALSGGIGAELSGGDFWRGAGTGATVALLNHYSKPLQQRLERPGKVNLKKNPVRGFKRWMRYINRYKGVDPITDRSFNLSEIVNSQTIPEKHWFSEIFGSMTNDGVSGFSRVNGKMVRWSIVDRTMSDCASNNIDYISTPREATYYNKSKVWMIRAYKYPTYGIFNLTFFDNETFSTFNNYIFDN